MATEQPDNAIMPDVSTQQISQFVDDNFLLTIFVAVEAATLFVGFAFNSVTIRLEQQGPPISDVIAGLAGAWAVVWVLLGCITGGILFASNLWMRYRRQI